MASKPQHSFNKARILIFGLGDLGVNIARLVVENEYSSACLLAGQSSAAEQWAQSLRISTGADVQARRVNGEDSGALNKLFSDFQPDLIVQCATLISPFAIKKLATPEAMAIIKGGFALQTAGQLPIIRNVMRVLGALGMNCPVINCSYPDVTNPILASEGLAPDAGIGNVAIMALRFRRLIAGGMDGDMRVIGHHGQLSRSLAGETATSPTTVPLVYLNGRLLKEQELLLKPGLESGATMNHLAAATVLPILRGLLDRDSTSKTHAPGIMGLPGGYPIQFVGGKIRLNLPDGLSREDAIQFNTLAGAGDGIDRIGEDGTLFYSKQAQEAVASWCPELAEPLTLSNVDKRLELLKAVSQI